MEWSLVAFSGAVALPAAALIKYGALYLIDKAQKTAFQEAVRDVMRGDMKEEIIDRIDYVTEQTLIKVMYGERYEVKDKEGKVIGKIGRTD